MPGPRTVLPRRVPLGDSWAGDETSLTLGDLAYEGVRTGRWGGRQGGPARVLLCGASFHSALIIIFDVRKQLEYAASGWNWATWHGPAQ